MSSYQQITRHPQTGKYEVAFWIDDYFAHHAYGVKFESDGKVYPVEQVSKGMIHNLWANDVKKAFQSYILATQNVKEDDYEYTKGELLIFLNGIEKEYKARWKRDPIDGEGAVAWYKEYKKG
jgi:hypothetical protein